MSKLKSLASQTAVYGVSSILGRMLSYALVILHTEVFNTGEMGVVNYFYGYVAILLVVYTFGMETAFFRFSGKRPVKEVFSETATAVLSLSTVFTVLLLVFAPQLAAAGNFPDTAIYIRWLALALWIDAILAIPYALMRQQNRAKLFATTKIINIFLTVGLQLFFLLVVPWLREKGVAQLEWIPDLGIGYIFLTNLISNIILVIILHKWIFRFRLGKINWTSFKPIVFYATPIMITGFAGILNENLDVILIEELLPDSFYNQMNSIQAVGVYKQTFKLSIFMLLGIQAFRYAGEPFFFGQAEDKEAPALFGRVMHYFVLACLVVLVLVTLNVDLIAQIFLRRPEYRVALYLVPILLTGKLFYGIYMNLGIWFKLTDKTIYGMFFSLLGANITIVGNFFLIPVFGIDAPAWISVACYMSMAIVCYYYGQKYYPIPYNFLPLFIYFLIAMAIVAGSLYWHHPDFTIDSVIRIGISLLLVAVLWIREWSEIKKTRKASEKHNQ